MMQHSKQSQQPEPSQQAQLKPRVSTWLRVTLGVMLVVVLVVGFMGYLTPAMRVSWEAVAAMCGF
jgi:quinol-cytochrome oxidoreductase complex cytochrome b subunit